jgi:lipopolysaccharide heptosyltransferase II
MGIVGYDIQPPFARRARTYLIHHVIKKWLQRVVYGSLGIIGLAARIGRIGRSLPPLTPATFHPRRILVIRTDLMGDLVLSLPGIHAMHRAYPEATIDVLVLAANVGVVRHDPAISRIVTYDPNIWRRPGAFVRSASYKELLGVLRDLRSVRYDLCLSLCGDWASILAFFSRSRRRVGYGGEAYPFFMTDAVPGRRYRTRQHEVDYVLGVAQAAGGIVGEGQREPIMTVSEQAKEEVRALLAEHGIRKGDIVIAAHAGATNGLAKRWPLSYWAALADRLIEELGARVILTGASGDASITSAIGAKMRHQPLDFAGKTSVQQLAALLGQCDLVISGDSGPLHMAGAVGTPVIAIHGPTDPALSGPAGKDAVVLRLGLFCSPCYDASLWAECRFFHPVCMKGILPDEVFGAAHACLERVGRIQRQAPVGPHT